MLDCCLKIGPPDCKVVLAAFQYHISAIQLTFVQGASFQRNIVLYPRTVLQRRETDEKDTSIRLDDYLDG